MWLLDMMIIINILKGANINDITLISLPSTGDDTEMDTLVCSTNQASYNLYRISLLIFLLLVCSLV